jgi:HEAT repeat protein
MTQAADDPERNRTLKEALRSDDASIRFNAGLDLVRQKDVAGIPALIEAFEHESGVVRLFHASRALAELGELAVPALMAALASESSLTRVDAAYTLYRIDPSRFEELLPVAIAALGEDSGPARDDLISFLGEGGAAARAAVPALIERLRAPQELEDPQAWGSDARIRIAALLARIGEPQEEIVPALIDALRGDAASLRWGAAIALGELGEAARPALPDLLAVVRDEAEVEAVRVEAAYAVAVHGDPDAEVVPVLQDLLRSQDWWVRAFACRILGAIGSPLSEPEEAGSGARLNPSYAARRRAQRAANPAGTVAPALAATLADPEVNVRRNAAWALSLLGAQAAPAIPELVAVLSSHDTGPVAAEALAKIGEAAVPALAAALACDGELERGHAAYALGLIDFAAARVVLTAPRTAGPLQPLRPSVHHFFVQAPVTLDDTKLVAFAALYEATLARGTSCEIDYRLPYPRHEFLRYLVERRGLLLHGSGRTDLDVLRPLRVSTDSNDHGNVSGVYADRDPVRPIYFAVIHRARCFGLDNGFFDLTEDGKVAEGEAERFDRRFYRLTISVTGLRRYPWREGMVYVLSPDTFQYWNEWTSRVPVRPLMKLAVAPDDLPLRDEVWGADWSQPGSSWINPEEPFPFLNDVRATPIRPHGARSV